MINWDLVFWQLQVSAVPILLAITIHEAAHAWVAWKLGDDTARRQGRVTFNPIRHVDPFGTILMPAMLLLLSGGRMMLGYAKPVPVNFRRLRRPRQDMVLVAAAGPAANILMALAAAAILALATAVALRFPLIVQANLASAIKWNVLLAVFNMLPIPPLDGGRVAVGLLPDPLARPLARLEPYGFIIVIGMVFLLPMAGTAAGIDLNVFHWLVIEPTTWAINVIWSIFGLI